MCRLSTLFVQITFLEKRPGLYVETETALDHKHSVGLKKVHGDKNKRYLIVSCDGNVYSDTTKPRCADHHGMWANFSRETFEATPPKSVIGKMLT